MSVLAESLRQKVSQLLGTLIHQERARIVVPTYGQESGFWFGGGNLAQDESGTIWLSGRYRNVGDSRTGLEAGQRGLECAIFRSDDGGHTFTKVSFWTKSDLSVAERIISYEGTALYQRTDGIWELFISSEKDRPYPESLKSYQKPGTGIWTIDRMTGPSPDRLDPATLAPVLAVTDRPEYLHVKDPVVFETPSGQTALVFCSHPFSWSASNSGLALRAMNTGPFSIASWEMVNRGPCWDVAATRVTDRLRIPQIGIFRDLPPCSVFFYDGAECIRDHEESARAHSRPRGYSCEEIGGAFFGWDEDFPKVERLSVTAPMFVSPYGSGCSRYVSTLTTEQGIFAVWQQAQTAGSQPLVGHRLDWESLD
jgi:hypothetical protein